MRRALSSPLVSLAALGFGLLAAAVVRARTRRSLHVTEHLDLQRYMGRWYEIARIPNRFERGCHQAIATYSLCADGTVEVVNRCTVGGRLDEARGRAWAPDPSVPARLRVRFRWPFSGAYHVLHVDDDYQYAVVGEPARRYAWLLARRRAVSDTTYQRLLDVLEREGYDIDQLVRVADTAGSEGAEKPQPFDIVEEAGRESFPASDPPSFSPGRA